MKNNILIFIIISFFSLTIKGQTPSDPNDDDYRNDILQLNTITTAVPFLIIYPDSR